MGLGAREIDSDARRSRLMGSVLHRAVLALGTANPGAVSVDELEQAAVSRQQSVASATAAGSWLAARRERDHVVDQHGSQTCFSRIALDGRQGCYSFVRQAVHGVDCEDI
jgi:hypothetical protein